MSIDLHSPKNRAKTFSWSYSKLKNYETCPRRYEEVDVKKSIPEGQGRSPELERGDELHEAMRNRVQGSTPLPPQFIYMEKWAEKLTRVLHPYQIIRTEEKLSTDQYGRPTGYFDKTTWVRVKIDYMRTLPSSSEGVDIGHIVDYKTGKPPKVWDGTQLFINAFVVFNHYKHIQKIRVDYLWTEWDDTTHGTFTRAQMPEMMAQITPRVSKLEEAHRTGIFEAKPCGLCREYCPVTSCEFYGKGLRR